MNESKGCRGDFTAKDGMCGACCVSFANHDQSAFDGLSRLYALLLNVLESECSSRSLDDETDRQATARALASALAGKVQP